MAFNPLQMQFHIADTFTDALARLPSQEQKAVKTSAFDLQMNPAAPGLQFHRIDKSKDPNLVHARQPRHKLRYTPGTKCRHLIGNIALRFGYGEDDGACRRKYAKARA